MAFSHAQCIGSYVVVFARSGNGHVLPRPKKNVVAFIP